MWLFFVIVALIVLLTVVFFIKRKFVFSLFKKGNVIVTGLRGTGKDMLFGNVIARRKQPYVSNVDYSCKRSVYLPLRISDLDVPDTCENFIFNHFVEYNYPYPEKVDIYISDGGVYFPSQYQGQLCKEFEGLPYFQALSRHLGNCNFHVNVQNLNRLWDKIREQSDLYIRCISCRVLGKLVIQKVIYYDKYEACLSRVEPYVHIKAPLTLSSKVRAEYKARDAQLFREFRERNGTVKKYTLIYFNKSKYDTRLFKSLLCRKGGNYE